MGGRDVDGEVLGLMKMKVEQIKGLCRGHERK